MPGSKQELKSWSEDNGKDKLGDFVDRYWHYDNIIKRYPHASSKSDYRDADTRGSQNAKKSQ